MSNTENTIVPARLSSVITKGKKTIKLVFKLSNHQPIFLSVKPVFSNRSAFGKAFIAMTGIKPSDFSGSDPVRIMTGQQCYLALQPLADENKQKITGIFPSLSPQLKIDWKHE